VDTGNELDVLIIHSIYASEAVQSSPLDRVAMVIFIHTIQTHPQNQDKRSCKHQQRQQDKICVPVHVLVLLRGLMFTNLSSAETVGTPDHMALGTLA
jgi:hypothetical protein